MTDLLTLMPLPSGKARQVAAAKRRWESPEYRTKQVTAQRRSHGAAHMQMMREKARSQAALEKRRQKQKAKWRDPAFSEKVKRARWSPRQRREHAQKIAAYHRRRRGEA